MEMFKYAFMQRAFIVGILLAAVIPCIGIVVVCKRLSMIGDALSHTSLAGVAIGLILGINPVFTASVTCVLAALGMEGIRRKLPRFSEISIAITMSAGIGLAGVLSGFVKNTANFNSFLFGSIVAISNEELYLVVSICMAVLLLFILFYKSIAKVKMDDCTLFTLYSVRTTIFTGNILLPELYGIFLPTFRTCPDAQPESVP